MDPTRVESLCLAYVGVLFTVTAVVLAWTQSDLSWLAIYGTGPLFLALGVYRLRFADHVANPASEFSPRVYSLLVLAALATLIVAFQFYAHFG